MMYGYGYGLWNLSFLYVVKLIFIVMLFSCLLVMMVRQRETIKVLREIRDKM